MVNEDYIQEAYVPGDQDSVEFEYNKVFEEQGEADKKQAIKSEEPFKKAHAIKRADTCWESSPKR